MYRHRMPTNLESETEYSPTPKETCVRVKNDNNMDIWCDQNFQVLLIFEVIPKGDKLHYDELLSELKTFLPFITKVIESSDELNISPQYVSNLMTFSTMVDMGRLSLNILKICKRVFNVLFDKYCKPLILIHSRLQFRHQRYHGS